MTPLKPSISGFGPYAGETKLPSYPDTAIRKTAKRFFKEVLFASFSFKKRKKKKKKDFFLDFYRVQNNAAKSDEQRDFVLRLMEDIWGTGKEAFV